MRSLENDVDVCVYNYFESIQHMQKEWDAFVESCCSDIFQTFDWCRVWWDYYGKGRRLCLFVFRQGDKIVGILPLFIDEVFLFPCNIRILRYVGSDYTLCQFSPAIDREHLAEVARTFFNSLAGLNVDLIHFGPLAGLCHNTKAILTAMKEYGAGSYHTDLKNNGFQTYFELSESWDNYLSRLNKKQRYNLKRHYKRAELEYRGGGQELHSNVVCAEDFDKAFDEFIMLHTAYWNKLNRPGHFGDWPRAAQFHKAVAKRQLSCGRLRLLKVSIGPECLGYEYAYAYGKYSFGILSGRSDKDELSDFGIGRLIFAEQVKQAIRDGSLYIDSMRGEYTHKSEWGGELHNITSVYITSNAYASKLKVAYLCFFRKFLHRVYYRLLYGILFPIFKIRTAGLCDIWIRTRL